MAKNIFIVDAYQLDGEGGYAHRSGYPKAFNSDAYDQNVDTALNRATAAFATAWAEACNTAEQKQLQTCTLMDITGLQLDRKCVGAIVEPEPEPNAE